MFVARFVFAVSIAVVGSGCTAVYEVHRVHHPEPVRSQEIPAGHLPPPGSCRVWYDDRPAGHQPPPTSCREAERTAARERGARVIYSESR
jgi:hypothetical protein